MIKNMLTMKVFFLVNSTWLRIRHLPLAPYVALIHEVPEGAKNAGNPSY